MAGASLGASRAPEGWNLLAKMCTRGLAPRPIAFLMVLLLTGTAVQIVGAEEEAQPAEFDCPGFEVLEWMGPVCPQSDGLLAVYSRDGKFQGYTHGGDPHMAADEAGDEAAAGQHSSDLIPPKCVTASDYRTVVIYAHASDDTDRWSTMYWEISDTVVGINTHLRVDAGRFDVQVDYKVRCNDQGTPHVYKATLPTKRAHTDFSTIVSDLKGLGFDDPKAKYMVYYDDSPPGAPAGIGHIYRDDRLSIHNHNNGNTQPMYGVTFGTVSHRTLMHEHGHNMGAVQLSAPQSTGSLHCFDGSDIMCYDDGGSNGHLYSTSTCRDGDLLSGYREYFDCNNDDYFHPAPPSGSYLASHWNTGSSLNRFLAFDTCGLAREGTLTAPGTLFAISGTTTVTETGIPSSCWGRTFSLVSDAQYLKSDLDVCFYQGNTELECFDTFGEETGTIPSGTTEARIHFFTGAEGAYLLYVV